MPFLRSASLRRRKRKSNDSVGVLCTGLSFTSDVVGIEAAHTI